MSKDSNTHLEEKLHDMLAQPMPPRNLENILQNNLIDQIHEEQSIATSRKWKFGLVTSLVANFMFAVLMITPLVNVKNDALLNMAYEHVLHEEDLDGEFVTDYKGWFASQGIEQPPKKYNVGLVKNCLIGLDTARHMRLVNQEKKFINLLVFPQHLKAELPAGDSGERGSQRWVKLDSPNGIQALAFYDHVIPTAEVKELVRGMFKNKVANMARIHGNKEYISSI